MKKIVRPTIRLTEAQNNWFKEQCRKKGLSFQQYVTSIFSVIGMPNADEEEPAEQMTIYDVLDDAKNEKKQRD